MTKLILVRHGETEGNVQQVWHGSLDAPLTPRGEIQVTATAQFLQDLSRRYPIAEFYVSPLARAQSTAAAIADAIGIEPTIFDGLREFDLGDWEGRTFLELKERENLWERWRHDPYFAPPNGESPRSFHKRALDALETLADLHREQTVLLVTHGGIICNVLAAWLGKGPDDWRSWEPHNCAVSLLERQRERWQALLLNDIHHLPPEAVVPTDQSVYATDDRRPTTDDRR